MIIQTCPRYEQANYWLVGWLWGVFGVHPIPPAVLSPEGERSVVDMFLFRKRKAKTPLKTEGGANCSIDWLFPRLVPRGFCLIWLKPSSTCNYFFLVLDCNIFKKKSSVKHNIRSMPPDPYVFCLAPADLTRRNTWHDAKLQMLPANSQCYSDTLIVYH